MNSLEVNKQIFELIVSEHLTNVKKQLKKLCRGRFKKLMSLTSNKTSSHGSNQSESP